MSNDPANRRERGKDRAARLGYLVVALLAAGTLVIWTGIRARPRQPEPPVVVPVETLRPTVGTLARTLSLDSYVASDSVVTIYPKVSGTLLSLDVDVGSRVAVGRAIGRIDPEPFRLALSQAKAAFDNAAAVYERQKQLRATGSTTQANLDQAQAQYEALRSQYELAGLSLGYTTILSPAEGTVLARHVSKGALVSQSVPIVTVASRHDLVVEAAVPEPYALLFQTKGSSIATSAAIPAMGDRSYALRVRSLAPSIDVRTRTFAVKCEIEGDTTGVLPGMYTRVTFVTEEHREVAYLPYAALVGGTTLWYVDSAGHAQSMAFTPDFHNDEYFELPASLSGYTFILAGQHFLAAGAPVRPVHPSGASP